MSKEISVSNGISDLQWVKIPIPLTLLVIVTTVLHYLDFGCRGSFESCWWIDFWLGYIYIFDSV